MITINNQANLNRKILWPTNDLIGLLYKFKVVSVDFISRKGIIEMIEFESRRSKKQKHE